MAQMLSLPCPFLVAVRIFADMLMPLEMRFQFDGREYGNEYLRVPERLEVDDVEDTNDPQQGPVAVIEGWRLVASTCIIQSGWVPDNHVQARGLLVAGEVVNRFMLKFKKVRAQPASHIPLQHRCGYNRRMCTSLSPYAVTTAVCVHPSPHIHLHAARCLTMTEGIQWWVGTLCKLSICADCAQFAKSLQRCCRK